MGAAASASRRARDDALRARAEAARPGSLSVSVRDLSGAAHAIRAEPSDSIELGEPKPAAPRPMCCEQNQRASQSEETSPKKLQLSQKGK